MQPRRTIVDLYPVGTRTGDGIVVKHDRSAFALCRLCVETADKYPDLNAWVKALNIAGKNVILHSFTQRIGKSFSGQLWLYYREA